jgi:hypothetical protein
MTNKKRWQHLAKILTEENTPKTKDMSGQTCIKCEKGKYIETSLHDDWEGTLHCSKCNHETKRYLKIQEDTEVFGKLPRRVEADVMGQDSHDEQPELDDRKINVKDDDEGAMAKGQLELMASQAKTLLELMPDDAQLEGWVQSKLTLAAEMLDVVTHYLLDESPKASEDHKEEGLEEDRNNGLWDNIHAKRKRGEGPAKPGEKGYPDEKSWKKVTKE